MPKVVFAKEKREIDVPEGANLRQEALKAGVQVNFHPIEIRNGLLGRYLNCHGLGLCGTCQVLVKKGRENLSPKGWLERFNLSIMMAAIGHEDEMRLSCQVQVKGDCTVETRPEFNLSGDNFWQKPYPNK